MSLICWRPDDRPTQLDTFAQAAEDATGLDFDDYDSLWQWSVEDIDAFWTVFGRHVNLPADGSLSPALGHDPGGAGPGTVWFPNARLNYAEAMLQMPGRADDDVVVIGRSQSRGEIQLTASELRTQVASARAGLVRVGVGLGERVAAYAPNVPETLVLMLAAASLGAVFSSCAPEFGAQSVTDRWSQTEPVLLLAVDGYRYGAKDIDRRAEVSAIVEGLPSVRTVVWLSYLDPDAAPGQLHRNTISWSDLLAEAAQPAFSRVPFDHPLYVLYSSGTTGLPKPIVHGHGGITLEHLKALGLQMDLGPTDRFFWFSTTGWMMWNLLVSGLGVGSTVVMFDGDPAHPGLDTLWHLVDELGLTYFGTSAPFLLQCRKEELVPRDVADLRSLRGLGSTGAPLPAEGFTWAYENVSADLQLGSMSGGTDVCTSFVGSVPTVPVYAGEISRRLLGCAVESYDEQGRPVIGALGELVITRPMPSMPVGFWGDDGSRYRAAYFDDIPGVWRHGDWITINENGTCAITGRSDATLNRGGVRLGTSEFYSVVEALPQIADSLVVHLEDRDGGPGRLMLFVRLAGDAALDEELRRTVGHALRTQLSPRHVPDELYAVPALPRTLSGKKLEVPVKKILQGTPIDQAAAPGALDDPTALEHFTRFRAGGLPAPGVR
ncbi:acetoacetate--CoA ligase [Aeromicrobium sp.]|uniref:acetoacetate--CoA ligase n=1 Tax=Aeromicrobium sp. TaxID=1871063 RepID=UPI0028A880D2|nr:acetoacetate--CoA ligase [Aeromicrobium sp.]